MQTLTDIKSLLTAYNLHPKYRFGQNFLHDHNQMKKIVDTADIQPGAVVLEVGPGTGALSECLLDAGACLTAVEVDQDLQPVLEQRLAKYSGQVQFIFADVLAGKHKINPDVLSAVGGSDFTLVANLPYNTASPLLANLAIASVKEGGCMEKAVVMIQKEVAQRLLAGPGSKTYGSLGILIQALFDLEQIGTLPPSCFWPQPKVESAVVKLIRRRKRLVNDPQSFALFLHQLFSKRRKQIKAIVGADVVSAAGLEATARPESLNLEQLVHLFDRTEK